jgi:alkylation response protein AidB-like acyl-CoA dehydrogenase
VAADKHTPEITLAERAKLLDKARELAVDFDAIGAECDAANRFPTEMVPLYRDSGIAAAAVPRKYGGWGADIWTTSLIGRELAKGDPGIALSFNMHQAMVGIFRGTPALSDEARARALTDVAESGSIICGPFSEVRAGLADTDTDAVPDPRGGRRLTGKKNWSTLVEWSDVIALNVTVTDEHGKLPDDFREHAARESSFIIAAGSPGIAIERTWDTLGMRATGCQTLVLDDVYAPPPTYGGNFRQGLVGEAEWAAILFGGVYLGLAGKAFAATRDALKKKHLGATAAGADTDVKQVGYVQHALGRMRGEIEIAARTIESTALMAIEGRDVGEAAPARKAMWDLAKVATTEAAISVTDQGRRRGVAVVLERLFRDARAGILHSFSTDQLYDTFGRLELGLLG